MLTSGKDPSDVQKQPCRWAGSESTGGRPRRAQASSLEGQTLRRSRSARPRPSDAA